MQGLRKSGVTDAMLVELFMNEHIVFGTKL